MTFWSYFFVFLSGIRLMYIHVFQNALLSFRFMPQKLKYQLENRTLAPPSEGIAYICKGCVQKNAKGNFKT